MKLIYLSACMALVLSACGGSDTDTATGGNGLSSTLPPKNNISVPTIPKPKNPTTPASPSTPATPTPPATGGGTTPTTPTPPTALDIKDHNATRSPLVLHAGGYYHRLDNAAKKARLTPTTTSEKITPNVGEIIFSKDLTQLSPFNLAEDITVETKKGSHKQNISVAKTTGGHQNFEISSHVHYGVGDASTSNPGKVVLQTVILDGKALNALGGRDMPIGVAYALGHHTSGKDNFDDLLKNRAKGNKATYKGNAHRVDKVSHELKSGTSTFDFNFQTKKADAAIEIDGKKTEFAAMEIHGTNIKSFYTKNFKDDHNPVPNTDQGLRGYFYGEKAEFVGGSFFDEHGVGTFIAADESLKGSTKIE